MFCASIYVTQRERERERERITRAINRIARREFGITIKFTNERINYIIVYLRGALKGRS